MKKLVRSSEESKEKIKNAVRLITEPVVQTLSPLGRNVIYEDSNGQLNLTNDGVTIAKQIESDDPVEEAIINIVKHGALKTNQLAGDGTTTTTLFTSVLIDEGLKKIDDGVNPMHLKADLELLGKIFVNNLKPAEIKNDNELGYIAKVSANNDEEIAKNVVDVIQTAGEDGSIIIEDSGKDETVVEKNEGFIVEGGIFSPEYAERGGFIANLEDCHVLVTDKRIYYEEEAETILRVAIEAGVQNLVIVARDYIGKSVNVFSHNQVNNEAINLLLVKDPNCKENDNTSLSDLATYLGGPLITEKQGKLVDNLQADDFCLAKKVYANPSRTVLTPMVESTEELQELKKALKEEKENDPENEEVSRRLASLTSGMVVLKVGGNTQIETREKIFRYEDAINATRSAMKYGYLPGGGMGILGAYVPDNYPEEIRQIARKLAESSIRQIAKNCGQHEEYILSNCKPYVGVGYNAKENVFEDLVEAGVIDPYKVTELAVKNAISVANAVLTAGWIIVNEKDEDE
jgi:chaperonin GroEL